MICDLCDKPMIQGERVVRETPGQIVDGLFVQSDQDEIHHEECADGGL